MKENFKDALKAAMIDKDISVDTLAREINRSSATIKKWLKGTQKPSHKLLLLVLGEYLKEDRYYFINNVIQ